MNRAKALEILNGFPPDVCAALWGHLAEEGRAPLEPAQFGSDDDDPIWRYKIALFDAIDAALPKAQRSPAARRALDLANDGVNNLLTAQFQRGFETGVMAEEIRQTLLRHLGQRSESCRRDEDELQPGYMAELAELAELREAAATPDAA